MITDKFWKLMQELEQIPPVETEAEYWKAHKVFNKAVKVMTFSVKKLAGNPKEYVNNFEQLLDEGVRIKIITEEFKQEQLKKLLKELNAPTEFKFWLKEKLEKAKRKYGFKQ